MAIRSQKPSAVEPANSRFDNVRSDFGRHIVGPIAPRRALALLTLASLLFLSFGLADALHLGHDHDDHGSAEKCQVCYLVKTATIGVVIGVALYLVIHRDREFTPLLVSQRPARVGHGAPCSPRAPPRV